MTRRTKLLIIFGCISLLWMNTLSSEEISNHPYRIGIYADKGVGPHPDIKKAYAMNLVSIIKSLDNRFDPILIESKDITNGILNSCSVVIFPGGSGNAQFKSLRPKARVLINRFVNRGGGFIGICAGAYLAQTINYNKKRYSLNISSARVFNRCKNWNRGGAVTKIKITDQGKKIFPELADRNFIHLYYFNGPVLVQQNQKVQRYTNLMTFESDLNHVLPETKGETPGKTFMLIEKRGKGRVILVSGHPEATPGFRWILPRIVSVAAGIAIRKYPKQFVNPDKYPNEILFDDMWKNNEAELMSTLMNEDVSRGERLQAFESLQEMRSRDITNLFPKLLTDKSAALRERTANAIIFYDYFYCISNLKDSLKNETDGAAINAFKKALSYLEAIEP